jgi:uncharacterized membrane protein YeaQ/YmgE (transglycosylase-associated protein family)
VKVQIWLAAAGIALLAAPEVNAQAVMRGAQGGAAVGNKAAGPVGAVVGSVLGGASFGFRRAASTVLGVPEETGSTVHGRIPHKQRVVRR